MNSTVSRECGLRAGEIVGTRMLQRRREGVRLTTAGSELRVVVPPYLPEVLAAETASRLRSVAVAADVDVVWMETPFDAEFSLICERRADAGLGWLTSTSETLPVPLDVMNFGQFEPEVWIPSAGLRRSAPS
jgi:hypothetical protein